MIRCEVIKPFTLEKINEVKIIQKKNVTNSHLFSATDIFECTEEMLDYLTKGNAYKTSFVKVIEIIPDIKIKKTKKRKED